MKNKTIFTFLLLITSLRFALSQDKSETNVVYGDKHIFTIETPKNWINDKERARKIGLVCFFYPKNEVNSNKKNYFYANGIDKKTPSENLKGFIGSDIETFKKKYPKMSYTVQPVELTGGLRNGALYSYSNLTDRFKEEVLYSETDDSFIIFSFAAMTKEDYSMYQPVFDSFIASFNYRGNNPKPFLDYMKNKQ
jgi:hypothetical protein